MSLLDIRQGDSREPLIRCVCVHLCVCSCTHYTIKVRTVLGIEDICLVLTTSKACVRVTTFKFGVRIGLGLGISWNGYAQEKGLANTLAI